MPNSSLERPIQFDLNRIEFLETGKPPPGVQPPMCPWRMKLAVLFDEQIAQITGILAGLDDAWLDGGWMEFVIGHDLNFGMDSSPFKNRLKGFKKAAAAYLPERCGSGLGMGRLRDSCSIATP